MSTKRYFKVKNAVASGAQLTEVNRSTNLFQKIITTPYFSSQKRSITFSKIIRMYYNRNTHILSYTCITYKLKMLKERYQEKWENAYLTLKNARASRALRRALDPGQCVCSLSSHSGQYICKLIFSLQQKINLYFQKLLESFVMETYNFCYVPT